VIFSGRQPENARAIEFFARISPLAVNPPATDAQLLKF